MQKVLIFGNQPQNLVHIGNTLEANLPYVIHIAPDLQKARELIAANNYHLVIYETGKYDISQEDIVQILRQEGFLFSILIVAADLLHKDEFFRTQARYRSHYLPAPFTDKDLIGLARKLFHARRIPQQKFQRYRTNQETKMEPLTGGHGFNSQMYNLSQGGAYCEFVTEKTLTVGDVIRLRVPQESTGKAHILNAKIVWTTNRGRYSGKAGVGLKFISSQDAFRHMMEKV